MPTSHKRLLLNSSAPFIKPAAAPRRVNVIHDAHRRIIAAARKPRGLTPHKISQPMRRGGSADNDGDSDRAGDEPPDQFVPDPQVAAELGISLMSLWRYDRSEELAAMGWPEKITVNHRNFRSRRALEAYKLGMIKRAAADRKRLFAMSSELAAAVDTV